ncbi:hypothetical protein BS17DRAFT_781526 [Gyrodon lividus]|nr:hypothetical protein BS17DRAFT_781526 [Gyrodon lividus]
MGLLPTSISHEHHIDSSSGSESVLGAAVGDSHSQVLIPTEERMTISESSVDNSSSASERTEPTPCAGSDTGIAATPKRKRGRKARRDNPYPSWADSIDLETIEQKASARLFAMYACLPLRAHRRPAPQLSPVSRLPSELLVQIFTRAITRPPVAVRVRIRVQDVVPRRHVHPCVLGDATRVGQDAYGRLSDVHS